MIKIYGIKNCDTMKKTFKYFEERDIEYTFHDYKKQGADETVLMNAVGVHGWENVLNRRGTTWRKLPDGLKEKMDAEIALQTAIEHPSIIKRPLIVTEDGTILLGFDKDTYTERLAA